MEIKTNDPTINRPEGRRLIDAPAVLVNIADFIDQLKDESAWKNSDRNGITVFKTSGLTIVLSAFHKGAEITDLQVDGLLVLQLVEGEVSVCTNNDEKITLKEKQVLVLHGENQHVLTADKDSVVLLQTLKHE